MITMDSRQFRRGLRDAATTAKAVENAVALVMEIAAWVVVALMFVVVSVWFGLAWCGYVPGCVIGG